MSMNRKKNISTPEVVAEEPKDTHNLFRNGKVLFIVLSVLGLLAMLLMSRNAGMSGDEHFHLGHARDVMNFYKTLGKDSTAVHINPKNGANDLHMFGQLPDNISYLIYNTFNVDDIMSVRHAVSSIFGWLAMLFASLLAFRVSRSWYAALLTFLLAFFSPHLLGQSFNNLKDPPFAAMIMMGTYYLLCFFQTFSNPSKKVQIMLTLSIGLALATRVGGLLLIGYFGVFGIVYLLLRWIELRKEKKQKELKPIFYRLLAYGICISLVGFIVGILLWPYALVSPYAHVKSTFQDMSHWGVIIRHVYEGKMNWSDLNPWYYLPKYILITSPIAVILGACVYPLFGGLKRINWFNFFVVYFAFIFPVFWIIHTGANLYGGWRHATFMFPPFVAAAGLGFNALIEWVQRKIKNKSIRTENMVYACGIVGVLVLLAGPIRHIVKNHPYEYVFFNKFVGGIKGAYGNYEMDYYYHSTREASEWVIADVEKNGAPDSTRKTRVVTWHGPSVNYFFRHDTATFSTGFSRWYERGYNDWDYAIFTITGMNPELLKNKKAFPPKNTAYQIKVDDVPICIVLKREDKSDFYGHQAMQQGNFNVAAQKSAGLR